VSSWSFETGAKVRVGFEVGGERRLESWRRRRRREQSLDFLGERPGSFKRVEEIVRIEQGEKEGRMAKEDGEDEEGRKGGWDGELTCTPSP